ncbi:MAG: sulfite exporter TauE/SafE family protein [Myxococcaceae bacterium]|nr:sulfite exporter TauE/SafE family protein [Myxococcaceae bacterium]
MMLVLGAALSLVAGLSLGLLGGGGSLLTVPILVYVLGVNPRDSIATSLVVVGVTSAIGALSHARAGRVEWRVGLLFGAAGMVGAAVGGHLGRFVPPALLLAAFAVMVLTTARALLRKRPAQDPRSEEPPAERRLSVVLRNGFGVGLLTGLVGAGGGFMVVPALALFGGLSMPRAVATSLLVITLNSGSGLVSATQAGASVDWALAGGMSAASIIGTLLGARLGKGLSPDRLRRGFAIFSLALGVFILSRELSTLLLHLSSGWATALGAGLAVLVLVLASLSLVGARWAGSRPGEPAVTPKSVIDGSTPAP